MSTSPTDPATLDTPTTEVLRALFPDEQVTTVDYEATLHIGTEQLQIFPPRNDHGQVVHVARLFTPGNRTALMRVGATPGEAVNRVLCEAAKAEEAHLESLRVKLKVSELRLEKYRKLQGAR